MARGVLSGKPGLEEVLALSVALIQMVSLDTTAQGGLKGRPDAQNRPDGGELTDLPTMPAQNTQLSIQPVFTPTELILPEDTNFEDWAAIGQRLQWISRGIHFWIGDWLRFGERKWGEKYAQAIEETPFSLGTLQNDVWVTSAIDPSRRREQLTFNHHAVVAALPPAEQDRWLDKAESEGWSSRQLWTESRDGAPQPTTYYDGPATLVRQRHIWSLLLPDGVDIKIGPGTIVRIIVKET